MSTFSRRLSLTLLTPILAVACISAGNLGPNPNGAGGTSDGGSNGSDGGSANTGGQNSVGTGGTSRTGGGTGGAKSTSVGGANPTATGGSPNPGAGGSITTSTGGGAAITGGAASTTPPPTNGLGVYLPSAQAIAASGSDIAFQIQIKNLSTVSVDLSTITLRYWYQDEGLSSSASFTSYYVEIGYTTPVTVTGSINAAPVPVTGADHYVQLSFAGGGLAAQGNAQQNDTLTINGAMGSNQGTVVVTNDYSYSSAIGYDSNITLYASGTLIWGTEPGAAAAGTGGASGTGGGAGTGGNPATGGDQGLGGSLGTGGNLGTGGDQGLAGNSAVSGDSGTSGNSGVDAG